MNSAVAHAGAEGASGVVPLGADRKYEAFDARVLVEERRLRAQALSACAPQSLLARAKLALSRDPAPESPWEMLQRGATAEQLLASGYTLYECEVSGASLLQLLQHLSVDDVLRLGATYETLLRCGGAEAVAAGSLSIDTCLQLGGTVATLLRDGVLTRADQLPTGFTFDEMRARGLRRHHLRQIKFSPDRDCLRLGWDCERLRTFLAKKHS